MQQADRAEGRKAVIAAVIGNVLESYDFAVYAFVAGIIARKFFPQTDEVTALLSTFLAYASDSSPARSAASSSADSAIDAVAGRR